MNPELTNCGNCWFWEQYAPGMDAGLCRRYAPRPANEIVGWAETKIHDLCGEHRPTPPPTTKVPS